MSKTKLWRVTRRVFYKDGLKGNSCVFYDNPHAYQITSIQITVKPDDGKNGGMLFRTITPKAAARAYIRGNLYDWKRGVPMSKAQRARIPVEIRIQK